MRRPFTSGVSPIWSVPTPLSVMGVFWRSRAVVNSRTFGSVRELRSPTRLSNGVLAAAVMVPSASVTITGTLDRESRRARSSNTADASSVGDAIAS